MIKLSASLERPVIHIDESALGSQSAGDSALGSKSVNEQSISGNLDSRQSSSGNLRRKRPALMLPTPPISPSARSMSSCCSSEAGREAEERLRNARNGFFTDFVVRKNHKARSLIEDCTELVSEYLEDGRWESTGLTQEHADIILQEELLGSLTNDLNEFSRASGCLKGQAGGQAVSLKQHANNVFKHMRESKCLKAEVQHWLVRGKLLLLVGQARDRELETKDQRKERLRSFWSMYHTGANKREGATNMPNLLTAEASQSDAQGTRSRKGSKSPASDATTFTPDSRAERSAGIVTASEPLASHQNSQTAYPSFGKSDPWKHRGSKASHGLRIGRGEGTLSKLQGGLIRIDEDIRSQPQHRTTALSISTKWRQEGAALGMGKASSLPNLHGTTNKTTSLPLLKAKSLGKQNLLTQSLDVALSSVVSLPNLHSAQDKSSSVLEFTAKPSARDDNSGKKRLPRILKQVQMPWSDTQSTKVKKVQPTQDYLDACDVLGVVPNLTPFVTGHSTKLRVAGQGLGDQDLMPFIAMLPAMSRIDEVDLSENQLLTDKSLLPLLETLLGKPSSSTLLRLNLKWCLRNANRSGILSVVEGVTRLINEDNGLQFLQHIDLSHIAMGMRSHLPLCQAIRQHPCLKVVRLANIGLTGKVAYTCVVELMRCNSLETLDLGWNCFSEELFQHLGERIVASDHLRSLCVANSSGARGQTVLHGADKPVGFLMEQLAHDRSLTHLDISMNGIDFRGALVMEDALMNHPKLAEIDVSHNPLGTLGLRSGFRLLCWHNCGLMHFTCKVCSSDLEDDVASQIRQFNMTNPGGRYVLDLHRPYHRALLRMLYKTSERCSLSTCLAFTNLDYSKGKYTHAEKDKDGVWMVPTIGRLALTFSIQGAVAQGSLKHVPANNFALFLERYKAMMRLRTDARKIIPLLAQWRSLDGKDLEEMTMLDAIDRDFQFTYPQMKVLCMNRTVINEVMWRLLPCLVGGDPARFLSSQLLLNTWDHLQMLRRHKAFLGFNAENPTGRYVLDLSNPGDYSVASDILLLDCWEANTNPNKKLVDTSQRGNGSNIRNERYAGKTMFEYTSLAEFQLPETGILEFDYASSKRPPKNATVLDENTLSNLILSLEGATVKPQDQLGALRLLSHRFFLKALQLRELMGIYRVEAIRADLYVMCIMQLVDMHNEKVLRNRFEDLDALASLRRRLGEVVFFPFIQPEQTQFSFNFGQHEQRLAASLLITMMSKERWENLTDISYVHENGIANPLPLGVPRGWEDIDKMPTEGIFQGKYRCAPEDSNYAHRSQMHQKYSLWIAPAKAEDVMWWAVVPATPPDVLKLMDFLVSHFPDTSKAFTAINGEDGNGQITKLEFLEAFSKESALLRCKKFDGPDKKERITTVFRYLDPSSEGQISLGEWSILSHLSQEIKLSIKEFVKFLVRNFGDNLEDAWNAFDSDGGGDICLQEWTEELTEKGFFGASTAIFHYLDKDDEGTICQDEWQLLESFQESTKQRRTSMRRSRTMRSPKSSRMSSPKGSPKTRLRSVRDVTCGGSV